MGMNTDPVSLRRPWGQSYRLQCRECVRFLPDVERPTCRCGAEFRRIGEDRYEVIKHGRQ